MIEHICDHGQFYIPTYINRFSKLGSIFRMWFKPLQELVGDIVNYDTKENNGGRESIDYADLEQ